MFGHLMPVGSIEVRFKVWQGFYILSSSLRKNGYKYCIAIFAHSLTFKVNDGVT